VQITILTLFPQIFDVVFNHSILGRAQQKGLVTLRCIDIRDFAKDKHKSVDDKPYGGGVGMIMKVDIVAKAIEFARMKNIAKNKERVVLLDPRGEFFSQKIAQKFSKLEHLILVCGHYEGVDERIKHFVDSSLSIGKYILTGGEIPAMIVTDSIVRLIPNVLTHKEATLNESYTIGNTLEEPQYTRPPVFGKYKVPKILLSGNHKKISDWKENNKKIL
jgi:tRNA (guanine37-N1)-methyltransferase